MQIWIDPEVIDMFPDIRIGVVGISHLENTTDSTRQLRICELAESASPVWAQAKFGPSLDPLSSNMVSAWRDAYRRFGINPKRMRPSAEALVKRLMSGKPVPWINSLVNLYLSVSADCLIPVGGYDISLLRGDVSLTFTEEAEEFISTSGQRDTTQPGELVYRDAQGILTRAWNYRDALRTSISESTSAAVLVCESPGPPFPPQLVDEATHLLANRSEELLGCIVHAQIIDASLLRANDSKISLEG